MRHIILFLILVISMPLAHAAYSKNIHKQIHVSGDTFTADNLNFSVSIFFSSGKVSLQSAEFGVVIDAGRCTENMNYIFCAGDLSIDHHDYNSDKDIYKSEISVDMKLAIMEINRNFEKISFFTGDKVSVKTELKNIGTKDASNLFFEDTYPSNFIISDATKCILNGNSVTYNRDIGSDSTILCSYDIKTESAVEFDSKAKVKYFDGIENKETINSQKLIVKDDILKIELSQEPAYIGNESSLNIIFSSEEDITISFLRFILPENFAINRISNLTISGNIASFQGEMKKGEKISSKIIYISNKGGNYSIEIKGSYNIESRYVTLDKKAAVYVDYPRPEILFINKGSTIELNIKGAKERLKNLQVATKTTLPVKNISVKKLELLPKEIWQVEKTTVNATSGTYSYDVELGYQTQYGQFFKQKESYKVVYIPEDFSEETPAIANETPVLMDTENKTKNETPALLDITNKTANETQESNTANPKNWFSKNRYNLLIVMIVIIIVFLIKRKSKNS